VLIAFAEFDGVRALRIIHLNLKSATRNLPGLVAIDNAAIRRLWCLGPSVKTDMFLYYFAGLDNTRWPRFWRMEAHQVFQTPKGTESSQ